ncbi:predicted protein [Streptomyces viridochromogenes DSM 40736]|uniref:Predicted protein n=1 Tax=Streptomyces viridochromogenes (strain DSM 40736 / JCM 4977 / BCRC 1201 / Tue 494) TaxID=591159 RepID=D9X539_STRVT|nr:predicted protein [Streptomyces viridochromogenes DSM 40736]
MAGDEAAAAGAGALGGESDDRVRALGDGLGAAVTRVSPDVEQVLGRPPRTFAEWAARNAAAFT